jgi:capsular polysaccharide biosynthesis protein
MHGDSGTGGSNDRGYGSSGFRSTADPSPRQTQGPPPFMPEPEPTGLTLRDYISTLWRRKWIVLLLVVSAAVSTYFLSSLQVD